jgi:hypothetical protein
MNLIARNKRPMVVVETAHSSDPIDLKARFEALLNEADTEIRSRSNEISDAVLNAIAEPPDRVHSLRQTVFLAVHRTVVERFVQDLIDRMRSSDVRSSAGGGAWKCGTSSRSLRSARAARSSDAHGLLTSIMNGRDWIASRRRINSAVFIASPEDSP